MAENTTNNSANDIAIIGLSGRWPRARNATEFWKNIRSGTDCVTRFSARELEARGEAVDAPNYVRARSVLENVEQFEPGFFGILPKEAELMDPQHRVFLECCWEAMEDAGHIANDYPGAIGVFAGCSINTYFLANICTDRKFVEAFSESYPLGHFPTMLGALSDCLATRVSYKLNLRGPSFTIQSACSTSLVAVCQACQSLLTYQSDMALAGGVSITFPQRRGYLYQEGGMGSVDGFCKPFDASSKGTVFGSGAGVVLLKRLEDALNDGDHIYSVIKGYAVNNDGSSKVGFTAPSVDGQANAIATAIAMAEGDADSIVYVETHGTGTPMGDPLEFTALNKVFGAQTSARQYCALGTAKANVGHLEAAAGVTGLVNASLILANRELPPTVGFDSPSPNIDFANSPFFVNKTLKPLLESKGPLRAGVSSFGVGGTNAHVVLEEAPARPPLPPRTGNLLLLSARTSAALDKATSNLKVHLENNPNIDLSSVAYTLQVGRSPFAFRRAIACSDINEAVVSLEKRIRVPNQATKDQIPPVVFMFPGQSSQYKNMGAGLYKEDAKFRADIDTCSEILKPYLQVDLREPLVSKTATKLNLNETWLSQPALFVLGYAISRFWERLGITPQAMIGHSIGEFVAAWRAGVFSLEEALEIVAVRGRMAQELAPGVMLAVRMNEDEVSSFLNDDVSLAAVNGEQLIVLSGNDEAITEVERKLDEQGIAARRLATSHAFHSRMIEPMLAPFANYLERFMLRAPGLPFVSGVTGNWITAEESTNPQYWARHLREPVRFAQGIQMLRSVPERLLLEVGPGRVLCNLARQPLEGQVEPVTVASLPDSTDEKEVLGILNAAGAVWVHGVQLNWEELHTASAYRCSLPTYPFERERCWIDPPQGNATTKKRRANPPAELPPVEFATTMNHATTVETCPTTAPSRQARLRAALVDIFEDLSGKSLGKCDRGVTFLEMGFDSLFLTQVTQVLHREFGLSVAFRQLLDKESTPDALAAFLDSRLPAEVFPAEVSSSESAGPMPAEFHDKASKSTMAGAEVLPTDASASVIESVCREQLQAMSQLMERQLEMLRGAKLAPATKAQTVTGSATPAIPPAVLAGESTSVTTLGPYKPVQRESSNGLTSLQEIHVEALIRRYNERTAKSKNWTQQHRRILADPRVAAGFRSPWKDLVYPIVTVRSSGSQLWDLDGNSYIDLLNGFGPILFGHAPDFVTEAIHEQIEAGFEIGPQTLLAGACAELVCELTGNERVTFCNTGSEAVMAAIRLARTVTARDKIVLFAGSYHGTFNEVLVNGFRKEGVPQSRPIAPGIPRNQVADVIVLDYGTPESLEYIRQHVAEFAAVLVEPVQSRHPALQPVEFLREIRRLTENAGTALIFDEVVTGFRSHQGGIQALFDIQADLVSYGKVVGGGMPIGILAGRAKFMDALDGGMWQYGDKSIPEVGVTFFAGTFVRHPLALAACLAILKHLKQAGPALQQSLNDRTSTLAGDLNAIFYQNGAPIRIEHFASWFYFSIPSDHPNLSLLYYHLREKGIHIQEGFPCFLTTAHSEADLNAVVEAFRESVAELRRGGFLPDSQRGDVKTDQPAARPQTETFPWDVPSTESQIEIWLSANMGSEASCAFNESLTLRLLGTLDMAALQKALTELVARHESLRTVFTADGSRLHILGEVSVDVSLTDFSGQSPSECDRHLHDLIFADAGRPFNLTDGPLFRFTLARLQDNLHMLLFTVHHIVCDGWSTNVLLNELGLLYASQSAGSPCALPDPMPYRSYAIAQDKWKQSPDRAAVEAWWVEKFATPVTLLELPTDRPRGAVKSFHGDTARKSIGPAVYQQIKRFGAEQGCTLFATLLAGFKALLHRLTGQNDIVVGIPAAGQAMVGAESLVGHCVNFLPLRFLLDAESSCATLLKQVRETILDAYEQQNYTYGSLVQKLGLTRDPGRLPLLEVQFNLERVGNGLAFPGLDVQVEPCAKRFVNFDLFMNVVESESGLVIDCDYNCDLFDSATIDRWLGHFETMLMAMAADPRQEVASLQFLSEAEKKQLIVDWNDTRADYPREKCVHQLVETQATRTPGAVAVVFGDHQITYEKLVGDANRIARFLQNRGVGVGHRVGICLNRSAEMLTSMLGALMSGAAYVPLDPDFPLVRLKGMIEDAEPTLILTQTSVASRLAGSESIHVCLDSVWPEVIRLSADSISTSVTSEDPAYVIYTSGSTGKPKGVQIPHRAVVNLLSAMESQPGISSQDTLLAVTTLSFDIAVLELFLPLCVGGRVVIATREISSDGYQLLDLLRQSGTTVMQATPATWRLLIDSDWNERTNLKILCGGEALPRDLADELLARSSSVWNMYGPTETTVWSATSPVETGPGTVTIGPPIANTKFYVLDANGQLAPIGVAGELHIGGAGVASGYWNRPELTAEKFIADPFGENSADRLYRTGDLVRYRPDGSFEFLGRIDTQVKVRGFRIETGEVEAVLQQYPGLRECVVVAREDSPGDNRLIAYLVSQESSPATGDLRRFLSATLPSYMVPSAFCHLDALPRTPNGKIDRNALPLPSASAPLRDRTEDAPRNPEEKSLAHICATVLKLDFVGVHDDLFDLGLNSLQMFQILSRAQVSGLNMKPRQIWAGRTVAAICDDLKSADKPARKTEAHRLAPVAREGYRVTRSHLNGASEAHG